MFFIISYWCNNAGLIFVSFSLPNFTLLILLWGMVCCPSYYTDVIPEKMCGRGATGRGNFLRLGKFSACSTEFFSYMLLKGTINHNIKIVHSNALQDNLGSWFWVCNLNVVWTEQPRQHQPANIIYVVCGHFWMRMHPYTYLCLPVCPSVRLPVCPS
jgi:hypothetical protein